MSAGTPKVVVTNWVHPAVIEFLGSRFLLDSNQAMEPWSREEVAERAADAAAIMAFMPDVVDEELLLRCPKLRVVACALKGADNFNSAACTRHGVYLTIVPDLLTAPTAELAVGLVIALGRNLILGDKVVREGRFRGWRPTLYGKGLDRQTVGIVGMGAVGQAIAQRLRGFGCSLLYTDTKPLSEPQEHALGVALRPFGPLLAESDFVILAAPLTRETKHLIGPEALAQMKPGALLVNPARGSLVDEAAVAEGLRSGHLGGYAADTFEMEDWARSDRPLEVLQELRDHPLTVFTPHLGSAVDSVRHDIAMSAATEIVACLSGRRPAGAINEPSQARISSSAA